MPDALIAVLVVVVTAVVLALPRRRGRGSVPAAQLGSNRRRQVLRAIGGAIAVSLLPALTWHGVWWLGPAAGLAMLAAYVFALRPLPKSPVTPPGHTSPPVP